ncbi:TetR/AcrR family transcriptional regulator [Stagnihabitans tardus]|uniref:TetR family transcriptional regulator n=1 Tax=Stagnihabitans tardus TaxID=2699202 RepID=A0AAE4YEE8_9RHOB|nr:TetR/AcrR family transcriptional regulator [Stagnihabitans tardus]NBZ88170.1 TetR family transcriptional regulator [Stagnihabitans tardus]
MTADPEKPPRTLAREARRLQVIEATIATLAARGHARTTLTEVARTAGISHGLVLFHFDSKEKLLAETLAFLAEEYQTHWQAALDGAGEDPADQILALIAVDFAPALTTQARLGAWCAFWGEAQSRPDYQTACGEKDASYVAKMETICAALIRQRSYPLDPVIAARILRVVIEGTWLDLMTLHTPYAVDEARRTVMTALALCFPRHFAQDGSRLRA